MYKLIGVFQENCNGLERKTLQGMLDYLGVDEGTTNVREVELYSDNRGVTYAIANDNKDCCRKKITRTNFRDMIDSILKSDTDKSTKCINLLGQVTSALDELGYDISEMTNYIQGFILSSKSSKDKESTDENKKKLDADKMTTKMNELMSSFIESSFLLPKCMLERDSSEAEFLDELNRLELKLEEASTSRMSTEDDLKKEIDYLENFLNNGDSLTSDIITQLILSSKCNNNAYAELFDRLNVFESELKEETKAKPSPINPLDLLNFNNPGKMRNPSARCVIIPFIKGDK